MMTRLTTISFVLLALLCSFSNGAKLVARPAGMSNMTMPLMDGFKICPKKFNATGFTVTCEPKIDAKMVSFFVNNTFYRGESKAPFCISGDIGVKLSPWKPPYGYLSIKCVARSDNQPDDTIMVNGTIGCM